VRSSNLTGSVGHVLESTTEEFTGGMVFPHVESSSDSASWKSLGGEGSWESPFLQDVERSANSWLSWSLWLDWDFTGVVNPLATLESVPSLVDILEDVSTMMPVALVPGPS